MRGLATAALTLLVAASGAALGDEDYARGPVTGAGLLFRASFDQGAKADFGAGCLAMSYAAVYSGDPKWEFSFVEGRLGKALDAHAGRKGTVENACFKSQGHVCLPVGTLAFWFKATGPAPTVRIETQSNDYTAVKRVLELGGRAKSPIGVNLLSREYGAMPLTLDDKSWGDGGWHHVAVVWDEAQGMRGYVDGKEAGSTWGRGAFHRGYLSTGRLSLSDAIFDELRTYDWALPPTAIKLLAEGREVAAEAVAVEVPPEHRLRALSWTGAADDHFIAVAGPTRIRRVALSDARALRKSGWRAVDGRDDSVWPLFYHNYEYLKGGNLHLTPAKGATFNFIRATGMINRATLCEGAALERPAEVQALCAFAGDGFVQSGPLAKASAAAAVSVYRNADYSLWDKVDPAKKDAPQYRRMIHDLALLDVAPGGASTPETGTFYVTGQRVQSVSGAHRVRLIAWYRPEERVVFTAGTNAEPGQARVPALHYVHLMTPPQGQDTALSAVRLRLSAEGWKAGNRVNLRVHDPFNLWRALIDVDVRMERDGELDATLEFPPTLLPADTELWVTLISRDAGMLRCGPQGSRVTLHGPGMDGARAEYLAWQHRLLADTFAVQSEPRPWGRHREESDAFLRVALGQYDEAARMVSDLYKRFPTDAWTCGYMTYLHPHSKFFSQLPTPEPPKDAGAPEWALMEKELCKQSLAFARWWVDEQGVPNGETGSGHNDDTDLAQIWTNLILRYDPDNRLRENLFALNELVWKNWIRNGLNIESHTYRHSYEEGLNVTPLAALVDYGNPVLWERLLATARRFDEVYPLKDGKRYAVRGQLSADRIPKELGGNSLDSARLWHPGTMLVWYNGSRTLTRMLTEYFDGFANFQPQHMDIPHLLWQQTGEARFRRSYWDEMKVGGVDATWLRLENRSLPKDTPLEKVVATWGLGSIGGTDLLAFGDYQSLIFDYASWHFSRKKSYLVKPMLALWKQDHYVMPVWTRTGQSGDRVGPHTNLTDFMLFGGIPSAREHIVPNFAVSYEGFNAEMGALVIDDTPELLRWVGYNFEAKPQAGRLRVWRLAPGTYEVRMGVDENDDDRIDGEAPAQRMSLKRYAALEVTLPSRKAYIVEAKQVEKDVPLHERCDLAVTAQDATREGRRLTVVAHNIGCKATGPFEVVVKDARGKVMGRQKHAGLEGVEDLQDKKAAFVFENVTPGPVTVELTGPAKEIADHNNVTLVEGVR